MVVGVEKEEHTSIVYEIESWYTHLWNQSGDFSKKKLNILLTEERAIPLSTVHIPKRCATMFLAALLVVASSWKESDVIQQKNGYRKVIHLHTGAVLINTKQWLHEILKQMDATRKYPSEWGNPVTTEHTHWEVEIWPKALNT